ncbi:MAG: NAD-dependent epimerase/dehydratase family protein [Vibrio sp.]|uniref:NAD-dependent epimerase/dehydratase family protein n=1 Tax=Vibrio sp. TaxID=678 RepID=UPI003F3CDFA7
MDVLLTGSTGFVGSHLVAKYSIFKHVVRTSDIHSLGSVYVIESIDSTTNWSKAFEGVDAVIHLAGLAHSAHYSTQNYQDVNVGGTLRLASEARKAGVQRLVFVSSIGVNGNKITNKAFEHTDEVKPHNAYAQSKYDAELGLKKIAEETGLEVVIVRPTLVYGPNAPGNFGMLTKLVKKLPILPFGLANNRRDFIAVQNLADLLITCATHPNAAGHTFLASESETVSTKQFTNAIAKGLGKNVIQLPIPVSLMRLTGWLIGKSAMIEQLFGNLEVDSSNIQQVLGWTPPFTMEQAMAQLNDLGK